MAPELPEYFGGWVMLCSSSSLSSLVAPLESCFSFFGLLLPSFLLFFCPSFFLLVPFSFSFSFLFLSSIRRSSSMASSSTRSRSRQGGPNPAPVLCLLLPLSPPPFLRWLEEVLIFTSSGCSLVCEEKQGERAPSSGSEDRHTSVIRFSALPPVSYSLGKVRSGSV